MSTPLTMHAQVLKDYTDGTLHLTSVVKPTAGPGQVLVRVVASGLNPIDTKIRAGVAPYAMPELPAILGTDLAGVVELVGEGVSRFKIGDEVYGLTGGVRGLPGTLAEYSAVDADLLALKPENLSMREAAALPLVFLTAWEGLVDRANVQRGQRVFVQGGAGGVGHVAVQIAIAHGAHVFATASAQKADIVKAYGATPIDYRSTTIEQIVSEYADGVGFDLAYDTVGGSSLDDALVSVKPYGHVVSCAAFGVHNLAAGSLRCVTLSGVFVLLPMLSGNGRARHGEILEFATRLAEEGKLKPLLDEHVYSLEEAQNAHSLVESGQAVGKVVVNVGS